MALPAITSGMIISCQIRQMEETRLVTWGKENLPAMAEGLHLWVSEVSVSAQAGAQVFKLQKRDF